MDSYEKKYKEAVERMKSCVRGEHPDCLTEVLKTAEFVFPELKDSDDEVIRKEIISYVDRNHKRGFMYSHEAERCDLWLDWLERQGEGKKSVCEGKRDVFPNDLDKAIDLYYRTYGNKKGGFDFMSLEKFADIVKTFVEDYGQKSAEWSEYDKDMLDAIEACYKLNRPLQPEHFNWLKSLKDRVQPKQEWSKDDKDLMYDTLSNLTELKDRYGEGYGNVGKCIDWLKSLRPQNKWKPSKEQMKYLQFYSEQNNYDGTILTSLYNDLKKLKDV